MKFVLKLVIFLALVVGALMWLRNWQEKQPPPTPAPTAPISVPPVNAGQVAPAAGGASPAMPPTNARTAVERVAQRSGVRIVSWQSSGADAVVKVEWVGSSSGPGGDFLDNGLREGAFRDFDDMGSRYGYDRQNRQTWGATYRLRF